MQKLKFRVEESAGGHVRLQIVGHHGPIFDGKPHGKIELWNLSPVFSNIPQGTEFDVDWPLPGEKEENSSDS